MGPFFFRIWKSSIMEDESLRLMENFISSNANTCIELNFHSLLIGYQRFRNNPKSFPFKPWLWSSQPCEKYFRLSRSMTSTFHTKINFDTYEFMEHTKKIQYLQKSMASLEHNHKFPREAHRKLGEGEPMVKIEILEDCEIEEIVLNAQRQLVLDLKDVGVKNVPDNWWKDIQISNLDLTDDQEHADKSSTNEQRYAENEADLIHVHPNFLEQVRSLNLPDYEKFNTTDEIMRKSRFCKVVFNSKEFILRKSTVLWMISPDTPKISNDRLSRFIGTKFSNNINIVKNSYYSVFYDEDWYIGRAIEEIENKWNIKFLNKNLSEYEWPRKDDIQIVEKCFIYFGPVKLIGSHPFTISKYCEENIKKIYKKWKQTLHNE